MLFTKTRIRKKSVLKYFLEFALIFLAVFLGFVAENIREENEERKWEKEYVASLINDLQTDTTKLGQNLNRFREYSMRHDSVLTAFPKLEQGFNQVFFSNLMRMLGFPDFIYTDATIQQLRNSGGMRLIRSRKAREGILEYDAQVKKALINELALNQNLQNLISLNNKHLDLRLFFREIENGKTMQQMEVAQIPLLVTKDKAAVTEYYNNIYYYSQLCLVVSNDMQQVKNKATELIKLLKKEYPGEEVK